MPKLLTYLALKPSVLEVRSPPLPHARPDLRDLRPRTEGRPSVLLHAYCSSIAHAASASERDAGNATIHHAAMPRPAGERGCGIAAANHSQTRRPTSQHSQPASFRKNSH